MLYQKRSYATFFQSVLLCWLRFPQSFLFLVPFLHYITITLVNQSKNVSIATARSFCGNCSTNGAIARCGKHLCTNGKQSTILPNNKTLMDTKTAPADKSDECCFFIGIVLFGREVITLSNLLGLRLRKPRIYRTKKAPLQVLLGFWFYFAAQRQCSFASAERLLCKSFLYCNRTCNRSTNHRVVAHTDKTHHFDVCGNG